MDIERLFFMPLEKLENPKNGECIVNSYWVVHKERGVCFQKRREEWGKIPPRFSSCLPVCHHNEDMAKNILEKLYGSDDFEVRFIPVVYLGYYA
jgi:hypothetical protein